MGVRSISALACLAALVGAANLAYANVVDRDRIEDIRIAGISLNTRAQTAFNILLSAGYETDVDVYEEWWEPARSFVRGDPSSPSSSPDGYSEIVLERNGERLRAILLTTINPNDPFNVEDEIARVRSRLGLPNDAPRCGASPPNGTCEARDADGEARYFVQLLASHQRYEAATLVNVPAVGYEAPPPQESERPPPDLSMLDPIARPAATSDALEPCSLEGLRAVLNPLVPALESEVDRLATDFLSDNPGSGTTPPPQYAESFIGTPRHSIRSHALGPRTSWCTSPFAVSDVEWMSEQDLIDPDDKRDALLADHMDEAIDDTGLTEAEIREILIDGTRPAGVREVQMRRLYAFMEEVGQRELALDVRDSSLVFWLFSPNLITERAGGIVGEQNLNNPIRVVTRYSEHFGWPGTMTGNMLVGIADPRREDPWASTSIELYEPGDYSFVQPGAELRAVVMSRPPHDPGARSTNGGLYPVPNTSNALFTLEDGFFGGYRCGDDEKTVFIGEQSAYWGFLEGTLAIDEDWDPASDWVEGYIELQAYGIWRLTYRYQVIETGDPDCPYIPDVTEELLQDEISLSGEVRIPNGLGLPGRIAGSRGRTVQVGPAH
ncbi:MAG: hypothetical protein QNI99_02490 [Woeseiaceae bacterium]|nr:hypothetical protein [Woeseiaceae bacterium]